MDSWSKSENVYHNIPLVTVKSDVRYFPITKVSHVREIIRIKILPFFVAI